MEFCIETQTLKGILIAIYLVLTCEILPADAGLLAKWLVSLTSDREFQVRSPLVADSSALSPAVQGTHGLA